MNRSASLIAAFLCYLFFNNAVFASEKRALIIAVGNYDKAVTGWNPISSANDVPLVKSALESQGFTANHIAVLQDQSATKKAILAAINQLVENAQKGDQIVVHYSGHGQQITDDNNDEIDGYDEAIVPVDAHARFEKGVYEGENHLRDDEIGERLAALRKKVGKTGSVLLIMDSCHSGTASRGLSKTRGTQETFDTSTPKDEKSTQPEAGLFGLNAVEKADENLAPLICFYGASAHELNYETKDANGNGVGSLSLAFSDAFANASPTQTYEELFDQIKMKMAVLAPRQSPQAEGNLNQTLLGGEIEGKKNYFKVTTIYSDHSVQINGGNLMGVYQNSELTFYALGKDIAPENVLGKGKVVFADATTAEIEVTDNNIRINFKEAKAVMTKVNYGSISVSVKVDVKDQKLADALQKSFAKLPIITVVLSEADLVLEENNEFTRGEKLHLITAQEYEIYSGQNLDVENEAAAITQKIVAFAQAKYLRNIEMGNEDLDVYFEFIPISAKQVGRGTWREDERFSLDEKRDVSGNISFSAGDFFKIKVVNNGYEVAYFTLLDFQPDNEIGVLIPGKYENAADFVIKPGEEKELPRVYRFGPPFGTEVFKLIASSQPIDFKRILVDKGTVHRGANEQENNPFAALISDSFRSGENSRGTETMSVSPGNCNIQTVTFSIVK